MVEFRKECSHFIGLIIKISVVHKDVFSASQGMMSYFIGNARRLMLIENKSLFIVRIMHSTQVHSLGRIQ
jgi:hypothetical protein